MNMCKKGLVAGLLFGMCTVSYAQLPSLGGVPVLGEVLGGVLSNVGLEGIPSLPAGVGLNQLESLISLGTGVLENPQGLIDIGTGTGLPLVLELVPLVDVLSTNPAGLPDYLMGGGTVISPSLGAALPIPFLVVPL